MPWLNPESITTPGECYCCYWKDGEWCRDDEHYDDDGDDDDNYNDDDDDDDN